MKLGVSAWYPFQYQAAALRQLLGDFPVDVVALEDMPGSLHEPSVGPFIVAVEEGEPVPLIGVIGIVETLNRRFPERGLLPADPVGRARARGLSTMIDERFSRYCVSDMASHAGFNRPMWRDGSDAPARVLDTIPPLAALERHQASATSTFIMGERPTLPDALLAALWWTVEDQGRIADLTQYPWIAAWHERACAGQPFTKPTR